MCKTKITSTDMRFFQEAEIFIMIQLRWFNSDDDAPVRFFPFDHCTPWNSNSRAGQMQCSLTEGGVGGMIDFLWKW